MARSRRKATSSKQAKSAQVTQPQTAAGQTHAAIAQAPSPAARHRIAQRRRQRMVGKMRRFESILPAASWWAWIGVRPATDAGARARTATAGRSLGMAHVDVGPLRRALRARWLWVALALVAMAAAALVWVHTDERFFLYREDAQFNGLTYLDQDELWQLSEIDGWNVFWLDTESVRERLLQHPYIADADVYVAPLVDKVVVDITEARPVALWVTGLQDGVGAKQWLLADGRAVEPRGETPAGLLEITDPGATATAPGAALGTAINPEVLVSAQGLIARVPAVAQLRYNRQIGLNFSLPDQPYWVYWGDGADVERKLENLAASQKVLADSEAKRTIIDVRFARPFVK